MSNYRYFSSFLSHLTPAVSGKFFDRKPRFPRSKMFYPTLGIALHSRPVFRDGFLLAYTMWCWNSCWVGSALSFPVGFSSNSKKEAPIGVPGTSIRSVPTLTGEGINTHTQSKDILLDIVCISSLSLLQSLKPFENFGVVVVVLKPILVISPIGLGLSQGWSLSIHQLSKKSL